MLWHRDVQYHGVTCIAVDDVDGDGEFEIAVGTEYHGAINLFDREGAIRWGYKQTGIHATDIRVTQAGADKMLVYGTMDKRVVTVSAIDASPRWERLREVSSWVRKWVR